MARPRKAVGSSTGKIGKQARITRKIQEERVKVRRDGLATPPAWLSEDAKAEFARVAAEAAVIEHLDNLDLAILAIYADNYIRYTAASRAMQERGITVKTELGEAPSPYIAIADRAATQIMRCSAKLGLSTTDRLRLIVPTKEEKSVNKYIKYLT